MYDGETTEVPLTSYWSGEHSERGFRLDQWLFDPLFLFVLGCFALKPVAALAARKCKQAHPKRVVGAASSPKRDAS